MIMTSLSGSTKRTDSSEDKLSKPIIVDGRFVNPWPTWRWFSKLGILRFILFEKDERNIPSSRELDNTLPLVPVNADDFTTEPNGVRLMWIGHATVLFQFDGLTILTDPVFSSRVGPPLMRVSRRYRKAPCKVIDLPHIDAVVISHNHYDHLDQESVEHLNERFGSHLAWFVPLGMANWMRECGVENVHDLNWWESARIKGNNSVEFVCTPAQHWCGRGVFDTNKVLWGSWSIIGPRHRVFFNGDTGYCTAYKEIGEKYGPFDVAAIPIGAYLPREMLEPQHVDPEQAVMIHCDIRAKKTLGIHWGTFPLGREFYLDPPLKFAEAAQNHGLDPDDCFVLKHGEMRELDFGQPPQVYLHSRNVSGMYQNLSHIIKDLDLDPIFGSSTVCPSVGVSKCPPVCVPPLHDLTPS